jgi:aspartate/methionine/tyrosine aminotransferase
MNPLASELNNIIEDSCSALFGALSQLGKELYFPRGILTQTAEAREKAYRYNATIGIARSGGEAMHLDSVIGRVRGLSADQALDYAPSTGNPALRRAWLDWMLRKNPSLSGKEVSLPVVTSGITHGLTITGELFVDPGDVILLPDKFWGNYKMVYGVRRGAEIRTFPFFTGSGGFNIEGMTALLDRVLSEKGKAVLLLNFPNNPTGYSIKKKEAGELVRALASVTGPGRDAVVVADDAYFGLFYDDDVLTESIFGLLAGEGEHLFPVKLDGATKEIYVWGLRVGFITFSALAGGREGEVYSALEKKVGGAIRGNISNCPQLSQSILLEAIGDQDFADQAAEKLELMKSRALKVREVLGNPDYAAVWEPYPFNAGYFMCLRLRDVDAEELRVRLIEQYGVGVIAEGGTDIRIAFSSLEIDEIPDLFDIMYRCATEVQRGA